MQSEIIYVPNTKLVFLERFSSAFKADLSENEIKYIKEAESLGIPFSIITKQTLKRISLSDNPFKYTQEFKELTNPIRIASSLGYYLNQAKVECTLSKREEKIIQYLGLVAGEPLNIEGRLKIDNKEYELGRCIVPCQFYLIKDKI